MKLLRSLKTLGLASVLLAGCAAQQPLVHSRPGLTMDEFNKDKYACVQESRTSWHGGGTGLVGAASMISAKMQAQELANKLYRMCMAARGYQEQQAKSE